MRIRGPAGDVLWSGLLAVIILGPTLFVPGYALRGDMVFVPEQPWKEAWLGLDGSVPRAVPMDALVSVVSQVIPGQVVQKALLFLVLVFAGVGATRLVAHQPALARMAGATIYVWNPWVAERLLIGQWAAVAGYAALPWVALAAAGVRDRPRGGWPRLAVAMTLAAICSPSGGLVAGLVAIAVILARPTLRALATVLGTGLVANLPWLVPALLLPGGLAASESRAFAVFAARGESDLGLVPSLLSLGGIWKTSVVPVERSSELVVVLAVALTGLALAGLRAAWPADPGLLRGLAGAALISFAVAALPGWQPVTRLLDGAATEVPALAILRDSHRYLAPVALLLVPGMTAAVAGLVRQGRAAYGALAALVALAPVLLLPSLAWGAGGRLEPVRYPDEWTAVATLVAADPARTVVLPWTGSYRGFGWNEHRAMLDPAPRFLAGDVVIDDRVLVGDRVVPSEDPAVAALDRALRGPDAARSLRSLGVRWVLVEKGMPTGIGVPVGRVVHEGAGLRLVDLGAAEPTGHAAHRDGPPASPVLLADIGALSLLIVSFWSQLRRKTYHLTGAEHLGSVGRVT